MLLITESPTIRAIIFSIHSEGEMSIDGLRTEYGERDLGRIAQENSR